MSIFIALIKERIKYIALYFFFFGIVLISLALYRLPLSCLIYPFVLCCFFGLTAMLADFLSYRKKHKEYERLKNQASDSFGELPKAESLAEQDCLELIEIMQDKLLKLSEADSEKYNDMLNYFTVWVHQIKTPISAMKLSVQKEDSALSRRLSANLFRTEQYVEMVTAFMRLDSESNDFVFREYRLDDILRSSIKKFAPEFIDRRLKLEYEPSEKTVITDEKWLGFVIEQLLSNALKYTSEGGIRIYMADAERLVIEDSGIGISENDLPRIFEKGYTGYNGRIEKGSSGLGLYLCKRICGKLGTGIYAESKVGKGTRLILDLKRYKLSAE